MTDPVWPPPGITGSVPHSSTHYDVEHPTRPPTAGDYPGAIRSFVGTVQALTRTEHQRDQALATIARIGALADRWDKELGIGHTAVDDIARSYVTTLRAALTPP